MPVVAKADVVATLAKCNPEEVYRVVDVVPESPVPLEVAGSQIGIVEIGAGGPLHIGCCEADPASRFQSIKGVLQYAAPDQEREVLDYVVRVDSGHGQAWHRPGLRKVEVQTGTPADIGVQPAFQLAGTGAYAHEKWTTSTFRGFPKSPFPDRPVERRQAASQGSPYCDFDLLSHGIVTLLVYSSVEA